jgi:hypothetical protein
LVLVRVQVVGVRRLRRSLQVLLPRLSELSEPDGEVEGAAVLTLWMD